MIITTTGKVEGRSVDAYLGIVFGAVYLRISVQA